MSAYIVSKDHIDALVAVAIYGPRGVRTAGRWSIRYVLPDGIVGPNDLGMMLVNENVASVCYRYSSTPEGDIPGPIERYYLAPYFFDTEAVRHHAIPTIVETIKALACYEYQSCEHDGWQSSKALEFCHSLRKRVCDFLPGYEDAAGWDWNKPVTYPASVKAR